MRSLLAAAATIVAVAAAVLLTAVPSASAKACDDRLFGNKTFSLSQATGLSCPKARGIVKTILGISDSFTHRGYACKGTSNQRLEFRCTKGRKSFTFTRIA